MARPRIGMGASRGEDGEPVSAYRDEDKDEDEDTEAKTKAKAKENVEEEVEEENENEDPLLSQDGSQDDDEAAIAAAEEDDDAAEATAALKDEEEVDEDEEDDASAQETTSSPEKSAAGEVEEEGADEEKEDKQEDAAQGDDEEKEKEGDEEKEGGDDDDEGTNNNESDEDEDPDKLMVGGDIDKAAYALVTGVFFEDMEDPENRQVVSLPLTRLPATLGRSHDTKDKHFFGLGGKKVLSRQQCRIDYRDDRGGKVAMTNQNTEKMSYVSPPPTAKQVKIIRQDQEEELPKKGFFAIECLGKNRIFVDGLRVEQGQVALLHNKSSIKMNSYSLFFLLPENPEPSRMLMITLGPPKPKTKAKSVAPIATSSSSSSTGKKRKSTGTDDGDGGSSSVPSKSGTALVETLESTSISQLLAWFFEAIENNQWERRHQMIGGAITLNACKDAARSKAIQKIAKSENGVSRSEVMDWIKMSKRYSEWTLQILNKMELKSYQANVTKCLWKAGYRRNAPVGRFVRWNLPTAEELGPKQSLDDGIEDDESDEEDEEEGGDDAATSDKEEKQGSDDDDDNDEDKKDEEDNEEGDEESGGEGGDTKDEEVADSADEDDDDENDEKNSDDEEDDDDAEKADDDDVGDGSGQDDDDGSGKVDQSADAGNEDDEEEDVDDEEDDDAAAAPDGKRPRLNEDEAEDSEDEKMEETL